MSKILRSITASGAAVCFAVDSTDIVEKARQIHGTSPTITAALGRVLTAAALMGCEMKNEKDSLTLRFNGDGPCSSVIATSDYFGNVRGYASDPTVDLPLNGNNHLDVSGAIGRNGMLYVVKDIGLKEPYSGCVPFASGEVAEDITSYYARSEQLPTVCALGVLVDRDRTVKAAGGILIHLLPFAEEETVKQLEENLTDIKSITQMLTEGYSVEQMTDEFFKNIEHNSLDKFDIEYKCTCSREYVERTLITLGANELSSLAEDENGTEITCQFCNSTYKFTSDEIKELLKKATQNV